MIFKIYLYIITKLTLQTYYINTIDDFIAINQLEDQEIILNQSLDFNYYQESIPQQRLFGSFDGQNHYIRNLQLSELYVQDDEEFSSLFKPASSHVSILNIYFYNLKIQRGDSSTSHDKKVSLALLISQVMNCTIQNVTIIYGQLYSLGHENVQFIGSLIGNCIGTCNIINSYIQSEVILYHNTNFQLIQMPIGGLVGMCNQNCNFVNSYVNFQVESETIYTGLTIGGLVGVSKSTQFTALNCIIFQNHDLRYGLNVRLGGIFGDDRSQQVNITETQTQLISQINNSQVATNNIGFISGNNICENSKYQNLLVHGYTYTKDTKQQDTTQTFYIDKFGANTSISFVQQIEEQEEIQYYPTEIAETIYTYRKIDGINQCNFRAFSDQEGRVQQIAENGSTYYEYLYSKSDNICERLIMFSINQIFDQDGNCDEHNINQSCGQQATCQKYTINDIDSLYFQYNTIYQCTCDVNHTFYNQVCTLNSLIEEYEEMMPGPSEDIHQNPLEWLKDVDLDKNLALILGVSIPVVIILIILTVYLLYYIRKKKYYYTQFDQNLSQTMNNQNNKQLSIKKHKKVKKQKQNKSNIQAQQNTQSKIFSQTNNSIPMEQQSQILKNSTKKHKKHKSKKINNSQSQIQQSNLQNSTIIIPQTQSQQQPEQKQQPENNQEDNNQTKVQQLQLVTNIPQVMQPSEDLNKTFDERDFMDSKLVQTNHEQYLNIQPIKQLPIILPTNLQNQSQSKPKKIIKKKKSHK